MQDDGFQTVEGDQSSNWDRTMATQGDQQHVARPADQTFEVQIHAPDSLSPREATRHALYEQARILHEGSA
jgi:hypothetical protein